MFFLHLESGKQGVLRIIHAGMLNPTRLAVDTNGANQYAELGDPNTEPGFKQLAAMDAYVNIKDRPAAGSQHGPEANHFPHRCGLRALRHIPQPGGGGARGRLYFC